MKKICNDVTISEDIIQACILMHSTTSPFGTDEVLSIYRKDDVIVVQYFSEFDGTVMYTPYVGKHRYVTSYDTEEKAVELGLMFKDNNL